ncbi:hypothetical protein Sango_2452800 [Sesamum angolense]|uniref:Retrotransposon Copia-like N-terminal domain-containing protein n=1 Tax=Sesamum angolense TaxID=2727404 RepID=A0AAE1W819_9LAMI|nr:hypothetical protein Sango_2452800 [Sesamum angolense]
MPPLCSRRLPATTPLFASSRLSSARRRRRATTLHHLWPKCSLCYSSFSAPHALLRILLWSASFICLFVRIMATAEHKPALGTTVKLIGQNYILWSQAFNLFLGSQNKLHHILISPPPSTDDIFSTWQQADYSVMTWLLNSMEESVSPNVMFLTTAKAMWDAFHDMYSHEKNISRVFELYERLFSLKQDGRAVSDYFALLKGTSDEILLYHPLSCDAQTHKSQREDFLVVKFLSGLDNNLKRVRDHLLASDSVPTLSNALSRVFRVATGSSDSSSSSGTTTESSAMGVRVDKCWIKHGKPEWANTVISGGEPAVLEPSPNPSESVTLSCEEYEQLLHFPVANSATPTTFSSLGAFVVSHGKSWMLDSGATTHLTGSANIEDDWWRS